MSSGASRWIVLAKRNQVMTCDATLSCCSKERPFANTRRPKQNDSFVLAPSNSALFEQTTWPTWCTNNAWRHCNQCVNANETIQSNRTKQHHKVCKWKHKGSSKKAGKQPSWILPIQADVAVIIWIVLAADRFA